MHKSEMGKKILNFILVQAYPCNKKFVLFLDYELKMALLLQKCISEVLLSSLLFLILRRKQTYCNN